MKVKMLDSVPTIGVFYRKGEVHDVPDNIAVQWIERRYAEPAKGSKKKASEPPPSSASKKEEADE